MDNTIHVNSTSRMIQTLLGSSSPVTAGTGPSFQDVFHAETDLAEYKEAIQRKISQMPVHQTRLSDNFEISIPDAGYEAMRSDPEYESFVLDTIKREMATPNPMASMTGGATVFLRFGTEKQHYRADMFANGENKMETILNGKKKSYWEERQDRQEAQEELNDKIASVRADAKKLAEIKQVQGKKMSAADLSAASEILTILLQDLLSAGNAQ